MTRPRVTVAALSFLVLALAVGAAMVTGRQQQADSLVSSACKATLPGGEANAASSDVRLVSVERNLNTSEPPGRFHLCLFTGPSAGDVYGAVLVPVDPISDYAAAKTAVAEHLKARGIDPCRVVGWYVPGSTPRLDDLADNPTQCVPRVVAGDAGAEQWLPDVQAALARVTQASADQMEWRPRRPLTVVVVTRTDTAVDAYKRYVRTGSQDPPAEWVEQYEWLAKQGTSSFQEYSIIGAMILLNLTPIIQFDLVPEMMRARLQVSLAHEYTHFVQHDILAGGYAPEWFIEGQAAYQERIFRGARNIPLRHTFAAGAQRVGAAPRLQSITEAGDWRAHLHQAELGSMDTYGRAQATVAYLAERYGFPATTALLRNNRYGSRERFDDLLHTLTGIGVDELDDAVGAWLVAPGRVVFHDDFSQTASGSWVMTDANRRLAYADGGYIAAKLSDGDSEVLVFPIAWLGAFEAEVAAQLTSPRPGAILILEFCMAGDGGCYRWLIDSSSRSFTLLRKGREGEGPLIDWTPSTAIQESGVPNRLRVHAAGPEIRLSANGEEIARQSIAPTDQPLEQGFFSVFVGHRDGGQATAWFSDLTVWNASD